MAKQLPRLPEPDVTERNRLADLIHTFTFVDTASRQAGSVQALSDARHLAEAALARASGYLTSDRTILRARDRLFGAVGIDVMSLDEFAVLLDDTAETPENFRVTGTELAVKPGSLDAVLGYLRLRRVPDGLTQEYADAFAGQLRTHTVEERDEIIGVGLLRYSDTLNAPTRMLLHVRQDHVDADFLADGLLNMLCGEACVNSPITVELTELPEQSAVRRAAVLRGFVSIVDRRSMIKVALGQPITTRNWPEIARQTRRRTGLRMPEVPPSMEELRFGIAIVGSDGNSHNVRMSALEDALSPTLIIVPGRDGTIVPIARHFADDLLGTSTQATLFGRPQAALAAKRSYLSSPRMAHLLRADRPILFYESLRSGGRGGIVAVARVVDAIIVRKDEVPADVRRTSVIDDVDHLSSSPEVMATTFDNLLRLPRPVTLFELRRLGVDSANNFQTAAPITSESLAKIVERGWSNA